MTQASIILSAFNGGEWSEDLAGRIDNDYYASSCSYLSNLFCRIQGPITKRPGLRFVRRTKFANKKSILIRFQFSRTQTYFLEFGDLYMRVHKDHGTVTEAAKTITAITKANPASVTSAGHGYTTGDEVYISGVAGMTEVNGRWFKITSTGANTFTLQNLDGNNINSSSYTTYTSGGTAAKVYEITTTWAEADLPTLRWTQSADVMFFACSGKMPRTLTRSGHTSWTLADFDFEDGPYLTMNTSATTFTPSGTSGAITITASAATFASTDVGRWIRIKHASTWGAAKITAYTSTTQVSATVMTGLSFGATTASANWRLGLWTNTTYPQCVEFFQNRLYWFTNSQVDGSYSGDFYRFSPTESDGTVTDSNAVQRQLGARDVNDVIWAVDNEKALVIGTRDGEWVLKASTLGEAVTPTNINATRATDFGSKECMAARVQSNAVFVQKTGRMLCQMGFELQNDGFSTTDLNLFNTAINNDGIRYFAHVGHPDNHMFCVLESGKASVIAYNPSQAVRGWSRLSTKMGWFESVAAGSAPDGKRDEAWFVVKRRINGSYYRYIEYMEDFVRDDMLQEDAVLLDSSLSYDGRRYPAATITITGTGPYTFTATAGVFSAGDVGKVIRTKEGMAEISGYTSTTVVTVNTYIRDFDEAFYDANDWWICDEVSSVSGLEHLNGEEVTIVADGAVLPAVTVANGSVSLGSATGCVIHVGLKYSAIFRSQRPNSGAQDGTAQGKIKRIDKVVFRLWKSLGGTFGLSTSENRDDIFSRSPEDNMDVQIPLYTGDTEQLEVPGDYDRDSLFEVVHDEPLPFTLAAIILFLVTQDGR